MFRRGRQCFVLDYLSEEVLERQPEEVRSFLLETSVLQRFCAPLCDSITGRSDSRYMLETLERANLFRPALRAWAPHRVRAARSVAEAFLIHHWRLDPQGIGEVMAAMTGRE